MANSDIIPPISLDPTFRTYTSERAAQYAAARGSYSSPLIAEILSYHTATSGSYGTLLDLGCGPGNSTRDLALSFEHAVGADPSKSMVEAARSSGAVTGSGEKIRWVVGGAEECSRLEGVEEGVDMITAGMSAHWFDMPLFWAQAAKVLNYNGTVALWTKASLYCHPATTNASLVQRILFHLELDILGPYTILGNKLSRSLYADLLLPWTIKPPISAFPQSNSVRKVWDSNGILTDGKDFFGGSDELTLEDLDRAFDTASMVTRWREANPNLAGTEKDCVKECIEEIRVAMEGEEKIRMGAATVLLFFKKTL